MGRNQTNYRLNLLSFITAFSIALCCQTAFGQSASDQENFEFLFQKARSSVVAKIKQAESQGVGSKSYLAALAQIEAEKKAGGSEENATKLLDKLAASLDEQLARSKTIKSQKYLHPLQPTANQTPVPSGSLTPSSSSLSTSPSNQTKRLSEADFEPYMKDLTRRLKRAWFPPRERESTPIVVVFKIHRSGEMSDLQLKTPGPVSIANAAAMKAVENAAPFSRLPDGPEEVVDVQFTFAVTAGQPRVDYGP